MWNAKRLSIAHGRASKASYRSSFINPQARDIEFQFFIQQTEDEYPSWWTRNSFLNWFHDLPDNTSWNSYVCIIALLAIVWVTIGFTGIYFEFIDVVYNITYAVHVFAIGYYITSDWENNNINFWTVVSFLIDLGSFSHYVNSNKKESYKLVCYYLRLHRPFRYLWALNDYNLKGSVLGTTLKYCYIFLALRISWALFWLNLDMLESEFDTRSTVRRALQQMQRELWNMSSTSETSAFRFLSALYMVNKMFIPIGPSVAPASDEERILCLLVMISGCVVVTGAAVAALSLVISLYMRPEETFRSRYRLIMKEMKESRIPQRLRDKVETFYRMYWHKQKAVSATQLLPTFPPTLPATIYAEIYFEFSQKSRLLRDLSYQFLSELAKTMEIVNYIPGDAIIKRSARKSSIIYITYGDIEMLTAEDDTTAILRMTRGTMLSPGGCMLPCACGYSHLEIIAATFCTAHVLKTADLWRVILKHSSPSDHASFILSLFNDHLEKVKMHYQMKVPELVKHKSSILRFKRNLMALKETKNANGEPILARTDLLLDIAGHYLMRNRADASLTDESDKICLRPTFPCILQPHSSLQMAWNSFVAALILSVCISHPYHLVFLEHVPLEFRFYDYVVTTVYTVDLIVHLSTGANVEEGVPITFSQTSSQQCRNHWFVLDVLGTLPIFEFIGTGHFAGINKILRLPKVFRVLKSMEETCAYRTNVSRFLTYTLLLLMACFLVTALQQGFMCFSFDYCVITNFTHAPYWEQKPPGDTDGKQLAFGLYWSISMITFTAHKQAHTDSEGWKSVQWILYTMSVLEVSIVLRIFMEAVYSATIMVTTSLREDYDACIETVKNFLIRNQVDPVLRQRFINYLQLSWYTDKAYSMTHKKNSIFYDLPAHVSQDIVARQRIKYMQAIPFMRLLKKDVIKTVASKARLFYTSPNEILLNTGDLSNEMYVIKQGICEILSPETKTVVGDLSARHHFGDLNCLLRLPAFYTIRTVTHVQVFSIGRKHLIEALETPQIRYAMEYAKKQPEYNRALTRRPPFVAYQPPETTPNMERFRLPRKHETDHDFLDPFNKLGFLSILRYIFPRLTVRPDGQYLLRYEWVRAACALSSAMLFPSYSYLVLQWPWLYHATVLLDMAAWFDICQRMLIGYFNDQGVLVYHPSSTAAHYLKGAFITDLFGCLPLENLEADMMETMEKMYRVTPTKQFLMLNRLLQLYRLQSVLVGLPNYIERRDLVIIIKAVPIFMALTNVLTCLMVFHSVKIFYWQESGITKWLIVPFSDPGGSWVNLFERAFRFSITETPWNLHLAVHFWMVYEATSTGYNVFNPSNFDQMVVLFVGMACSAMIITYFSVRIISVRANVNKALAAFQEHMKDIVVFMRREHIDPELQKEVQQFYEYSWDKMGGIDYRGVLKLCDQITLRTDAILNIYGPTFAKCPILSTTNVSLLRTLGRAVHSEYFLRGMTIIQQDDVISSMYFVDYGGVDVRVTTEERCTVVKLPRGSVFGNLEPMMTNRCPMTLVAMSRVHLLKINSRAFYHIISDFPQARTVIDKYRQDNQYYVKGNVTEHSRLKRQRSLSGRRVVRGRRGLIEHVYFKESIVNTYLVIVCMACVYADMYNAGFQDNRVGLIVGLYTLDVCFYLKIVLQYTMPLVVDSASVKKILIPLRKAYFKGEFKIDLASCLPFELLGFLSKKHRWLIFSWLRLNRTLRIVTVYRCLRISRERITVNLMLSTVFAVLIWFSLFVHSTSCLWYFIALMQDQVHPNSSWIYKDPTSTRFMNSGESWCFNSYICSLYFVMTTFTQNGVGDILPKNHTEVVFVSALQIISLLLYMIYVGELSNLIQYQYFRSFAFYSMHLELQEFLKNNRVSKNLVSLVNKYSLHIWRESRGLQVPHFLTIAPNSLHLRIMSAAYVHHLNRHHIFEDCEPAFLRQLVGCLKLYTYNAGMYVVKESEITNAMYLIHTGKVRESTVNDAASGISSRVYPIGSYFGVGLIRDTPYNHSYLTMSKAQVLSLFLHDWEYLLAHFPLSKAVIHHNMKHVGSSEFSPDSWPGASRHNSKPPTDMSGLDVDIFPPPPPQGGIRLAKDKKEYEKLGEKSSEFESLEQLPEFSTEKPKHKLQQEQEKEIALRRTSHRSSMKPGTSWPLDSTLSRDNSSTSGKKPTDEEPTNTVLPSSQTFGPLKGPKYIHESINKSAFIQKVKSSAKRFMGKSDVDITHESSSLSSNASDNLLLEEDEETTAALLKQYDEIVEPQPKIKDNESREMKAIKVEFLEPSGEDHKEDKTHMAAVNIYEQKYTETEFSHSDFSANAKFDHKTEQLVDKNIHLSRGTPTKIVTESESTTKTVLETTTELAPIIEPDPELLKKNPETNLPVTIEPMPENKLTSTEMTDINSDDFPYQSGRQGIDDHDLLLDTTSHEPIPGPSTRNENEHSSPKSNRRIVHVRYDEQEGKNKEELQHPSPLDLLDAEDTVSLRDMILRRNLQKSLDKTQEDTESNTASMTEDSSVQSFKRKYQKKK